jgi:hypothetical protein
LSGVLNDYLGREVSISSDEYHLLNVVPGVLLSAGETDWKVLAININDPLAASLNGLLLYVVMYVNCAAYV